MSRDILQEMKENGKDDFDEVVDIEVTEEDMDKYVYYGFGRDEVKHG